jgi:NitT/TauT family transport system permease protein
MQQARDLSELSLVICYIIVVLVIGILIDLLFNAPTTPSASAGA